MTNHFLYKHKNVYVKFDQYLHKILNYIEFPEVFFLIEPEPWTMLTDTCFFLRDYIYTLITCFNIYIQYRHIGLYKNCSAHFLFMATQEEKLCY